MTKSVLTALTLLLVAVAAPQKASAQSEVLAEMYGRGVHAHYAGDSITAHEFLSMAIDNGIQDPRAYYFRGLVAYGSGRIEEAEADWKVGAELEAGGKINGGIGRSLSRFQGAARLKLESIRQRARLSALANAAARSKARYGEIQAAEARVLRQPPNPAVAPPAVAPPPAADTSNPFADDMASGEPTVQSDDALEGAMTNPFADEAAVSSGEVPPNATDNPFGENGGSDASNPFGDDTGGAMESSPFGDDADSNPFGDDSGGAMEDNPFGDNPFGT